MTPLHVVGQRGDKEMATFLFENGEQQHPFKRRCSSIYYVKLLGQVEFDWSFLTQTLHRRTQWAYLYVCCISISQGWLCCPWASFFQRRPTTSTAECLSMRFCVEQYGSRLTRKNVERPFARTYYMLLPSTTCIFVTTTTKPRRGHHDQGRQREDASAVGAAEQAHGDWRAPRRREEGHRGRKDQRERCRWQRQSQGQKSWRGVAAVCLSRCLSLLLFYIDR